MMDFVNNFHFLRPWYLLFLLLPVLLYLKKVNFGITTSSWEDICDKHLFQFLLIDNKNGKKVAFKKFIYIGLVSACIAMAGPSWKKVEVPALEINNPNMFVLSVAYDMTLRDVTPSRLERAKFLIQDVIKEVKQGQFGLEVYSLEPYVISPITDDKELIINLLPQISFDIMPDQGDRLDRAIDLAIKRFVDAKYSNGNIILFCADIGQRFDLAMEAVDEAKKRGYTVNVVDVSFEGNDKLEILAKNGNGVYVKARGGDISGLIENISKINDEKAKISQNLRSNYEDFGYYLLVLPLICVLMFFRKGLLVLGFLCFAFNAEASAWLNDNQLGLKLFNEQKYEEAVKKFKDSVWRSIALYKMNKNEEALKEIANEQSEIALYNKGVILTKLCKYEEAKKIFDEVIKKYPTNEDAKYNKKVLEELFLKAKEDPTVLQCGENQQQNNQNQQDNNQNKDKEKNDKNKNHEQSKNSQGDDEKSDDKEKQQSNEEQQNKKNTNDEDKNKEGNDDKSSDEKENNEQNDKNKDDNKNSNEKNDDKESNDNKNNEDKEDKPLDKNSNDNAKQKNGDKEDNESGGQDIQEKEMPLMNAQKTDKEEDFDEEAMVMQRRYREIPDDTGGLLREFIKKEYLKDRYNNENI